MGYYTRYKIDAVEIPASCEPTNGDAFAVVVAGLIGVEPMTLAEFNSELDDQKWYEHEADIAKAMKLTGARSVTLSGTGEENGDKWIKKFSVEDDDEVWCREYRYEFRLSESPSKEGRVKL